MYVCMYVYIYTCIDIHIYIYVYTYIYIYICMYVWDDLNTSLGHSPNVPVQTRQASPATATILGNGSVT